MNNLFEKLSINSKVDFIKTKTKVSLSDEIEYEYLDAIIKTNRHLFNWAKSLHITPSDVKDKFHIELYVGADNPNETLISEIYNRCKTKDWEPAKYGHDKPKINVLVDEGDLNKLINWYYSKLN